MLVGILMFFISKNFGAVVQHCAGRIELLHPDFLMIESSRPCFGAATWLADGYPGQSIFGPVTAESQIRVTGRGCTGLSSKGDAHYENRKITRSLSSNRDVGSWWKKKSRKLSASVSLIEG